MKNLDFKYMAAKNFLCYGAAGIELNLSDYSNVVLVRGINLDRQQVALSDASISERRIASNGSGKSSIPEIIIYTLFGKTIKTPKKITHDNVINNKTKKGLCTEIRWGNFRVIRTRKPNSLRIWESENGVWNDETEITLGGIPATQKRIEDKLGLSYETLTNVLVFTDNNAGSFLELDVPAKREIVENLLSLHRFRKYFDDTKSKRTNIKNQIKLITEGYQYVLDTLDSVKIRVAELTIKNKKWKIEKQKELEGINKQVEIKKEELAASDLSGALIVYHKAQDRITLFNEQILEFIDKDAKIKTIVSRAKLELDPIKNKVLELVSQTETHRSETRSESINIKKRKELISSLENQEGSQCPTCFGVVKKENYIATVNATKEQIEKSEAIIRKEDALLKKVKEELEQKTARKKQLESGISLGEGKSHAISRDLVVHRREISKLSTIQKPDIGSYEKILEQQLIKLKEETVAKEEEIKNPSPFMDILVSAKEEIKTKKQECQDKKKELDIFEEELPYYEFFVKAFGQDGIRRFVIDGILPALNSRVAYWLQFLIDSKISLVFNNQFEEVVERNPSDGDPFVYHAMSGGERRMLNLSVSQAFAHIMMLNSGTAPSLTFLDEVTTNIDQIGVQGVYNMIMELAREKQVFVTTHDHDLLEMLSGCDTIELQKQAGFTTLVQTNK